MKDFKFELDRGGVRVLLYSPEMQDILTEYAHQVAKNAGDNFMVWHGSTRAVAQVRSKNAAGDDENSKHNRLLKAVGGARK